MVERECCNVNRTEMLAQHVLDLSKCTSVPQVLVSVLIKPECDSSDEGRRQCSRPITKASAPPQLSKSHKNQVNSSPVPRGSSKFFCVWSFAFCSYDPCCSHHSTQWGFASQKNDMSTVIQGLVSWGMCERKRREKKLRL